MQDVTSEFWSRWCTEVTPQSIIRQKWHESQRNLQVGDVVLVHDQSPVKGKYQLAIVDEAKESKDGYVRSCVVKYRVPDPKDVVKTSGKEKKRYPAGKEAKITRSVQRLTLLLPVEEQSGRLEVDNGHVYSDD